MNLAQSVSTVVAIVFVVAALTTMRTRRRARQRGREFSMARVVGVTALTGTCGAVAGVLVTAAIRALALH